MRTLALALVLLLCTATDTLIRPAWANAPSIEHQCWDKSVLASSAEIQIGDCIEFVDDVDSSYCRELIVGGRSLGYFERLVAAGNRLLGHVCRELDVDLPFETEFLRYGTVSGDFSEIRRPASAAGQWSVVDFPVPDLGFYANPTFCGERIAHWRLDNGDLGVRVFDVDRRATLYAHELGAVLIETDDPSALPAPIWTEDCSSVRFPAGRGGQTIEVSF